MVQSLSQLRYPTSTHRPDTPCLTVEEVSVRYNGHYALEHVSFEIAQGERIAVVGPNGAGKSTLFKVVAGTLRPSSGSIRIYGEPPGGHTCIGYVPQRSQIDWTFPVTVSDVVMMGRSAKIGLFKWPRKNDWQVVQQSLERVGMVGLSNRQIGELSGGQQQRVFLARALAQEAELLLLDEPLSGLDVPSQESIFEAMELLKAQHVTLLVATHDLDQAAEQFDRMMLLNRRLVAFGLPHEVFTPQHLVTTYGGHLHVIPGEEPGREQIALTDACCDGSDR
ncbi:MAG: metal ABC transporter ATP-binding protein [Chloroflexi bacterium]|nr:metal ABC transporter ATP-binding protein [Chloroflexota bacterium]